MISQAAFHGYLSKQSRLSFPAIPRRLLPSAAYMATHPKWNPNNRPGASTGMGFAPIAKHLRPSKAYRATHTGRVPTTTTATAQQGAIKPPGSTRVPVVTKPSTVATTPANETDKNKST